MGTGFLLKGYRYLDVHSSKNIFIVLSLIDSTGISLKFKGSELVLNAKLLFRDTNGSLSVLVEDRERSQLYSLAFVCSSELITVSDSNLSTASITS